MTAIVHTTITWQPSYVRYGIATRVTGRRLCWNAWKSRIVFFPALMPMPSIALPPQIWPKSVPTSGPATPAVSARSSRKWTTAWRRASSRPSTAPATIANSVTFPNRGSAAWPRRAPAGRKATTAGTWIRTSSAWCRTCWKRTRSSCASWSAPAMPWSCRRPRTCRS